MTGYLPGIVGFAILFASLGLSRKVAWEIPVGIFGLLALVSGHALGLAWAPREAMMGDVGRILYVHVPAAWLSLVTFTIAFVGALGFLFTGRKGWDWLVEAACELGVVLTLMLLVLGSIFARPTWGTWWTWDPRLTASLVMMLTFVGVVLLRVILLFEPERRATWSAVATILAYVNIPITYLSVRWWRSIHQVQSSPGTMSDEMVTVLRWNAFALLFVSIFFLARRWRMARALALAAAPPPLPEPPPFQESRT